MIFPILTSFDRFRNEKQCTLQTEQHILTPNCQGKGRAQSSAVQEDVAKDDRQDTFGTW